MTDAINQTSQLVYILRQQLARGAPSSAPPGAAPRKPSVGLSDVQVSKLIAARVAGIDRDDPQKGRKAFRVFVEAVLAAHFGDAVGQDARFHQLVDDVQREMENSPGIAALVQPAIDHLLAH